MKKGHAGKMRSDLIDHVFQYGTKGDIAVTGDWNGDGIYTIGIFRNGVWFLDMDGDGRWSEGDLMVEFGQEGDMPVVGDWTGDGISKLGVYRNGTFYLDTNNNHQLDAADKVIRAGPAPATSRLSGDWTATAWTRWASTRTPPRPTCRCRQPGSSRQYIVVRASRLHLVHVAAQAQGLQPVGFAVWQVVKVACCIASRQGSLGSLNP